MAKHKPEVSWIGTLTGAKGYLVILENSDLEEKLERVGKDVFKARAVVTFKRAGMSAEADDIEVVSD